MKREFVINRHGKDYVLYAGLLDEAHRQGLKAIRTQLVQPPLPQNGQLAICTAEVTTERGTFSGIGDADPSSVSRTVANALIRLAETRAKARALRDALNVSMVSVEELADAASEALTIDDEPAPSPTPATAPAPSPATAPAGAAGSPASEPAAMPASIVSLVPRRALVESRGRPANGPANGARPAADKPAAEAPPAPATPTQLETIAKLARSIGRIVPTNDLTRAAASELITRLSEERYGARRG